ncbi:MAG: hypothetical protein RIT81_34995 [Deltaproteobacteria bacterium]
MAKLPRLVWLVPSVLFLGVTTWAFAALNQPAPMADWPEHVVEEEPQVTRPPAPVRAPPRRSLLAQIEKPAPAPEAPAPVDLRDVLSPSPEHTVAFVEVAALWRAPIGRAFEACLARESKREQFEITTMANAVERIATDGQVMAIEGDFTSAAVHEVLFGGREMTPYGDGTELYAGRGAKVSDRLVVVGKRHGSDVRGAVDRAEGRAATAPPKLDRYGEVSMQLPPRLLGRVLDDFVDVDPVEVFAVERATLHVDAVDDVIITLELFGSDPHALAALRDSLGLAAAALRGGGGFTSPSGPRVDDVQVAQDDGRLTVMVQMKPEEAIRIIPDCRRGAPEEVIR